MISKELKQRIEEELKEITRVPGSLYINDYAKCGDIKDIINYLSEIKRLIRQSYVKLYVKVPLRYPDEYTNQAIEFPKASELFIQHIDYRDAMFVFYDARNQSKQVSSSTINFKSFPIAPVALNINDSKNEKFEYWETVDEFNEYNRNLVVYDAG